MKKSCILKLINSYWEIWLNHMIEWTRRSVGLWKQTPHRMLPPQGKVWPSRGIYNCGVAYSIMTAITRLIVELYRTDISHLLSFFFFLCTVHFLLFIFWRKLSFFFVDAFENCRIISNSVYFTRKLCEPRHFDFDETLDTCRRGK